MPNPVVPAVAEGLPNRRTALALTGSGLVAALTTIATTSKASIHDASLAAVEALIQRHTDAVRAEKAAWDDVPEDDDPRRQHVRVQVGKLLKGRDDDGNDIWDPIWAYNDERIEQSINRHRDAMIGMWGHRPGETERLTDLYATKVTEKKEQLAALRAEDDRILAEIGYTAAEQKASAALDAVRALEHEILSFVPQTLAAAVRQAQWAIAGSEDDGDYYLDGADMQKLVQSIAAAGGVS